MAKASPVEPYQYAPQGSLKAYWLLGTVIAWFVAMMVGEFQWAGLLFLVAYGLQAAVTAEAARRKSRSFSAFVFLALVLPPIAWIAVAVMSPVVVPVAEVQSKVERVCPFCAEAIRRDAVVCRWCGRDVSSSPNMN